MRGVLHVVAVAEDENGARRVIRIGPWSPKSATDVFVLELSRARSDAILLTGAILREEPELRYELSSELEAWRRDVLGIEEPPRLLVLTGGRVPLDHPALASRARPILFTTEQSAPKLRGRSSIEVVAVAEPSARAALAYLRDVRGARSVSVEAGPTTAVPLYEAPCAIDELMLSVFEGPLEPRARGGAFPSEREIAAQFERVSVVRIDEPSGPWRFERWLRRSRR